MPVLWNEAYSTGIPRIDEQHKKLFAFFDDLGRRLNRDLDEQNVDAALFFLKTYAETHFVYEEMCMNRYRCPVAKLNREAHQDFLELFQLFQLRYEEEGHSRALLKEIHDRLEEWLKVHIAKIDAQLRECVQRQQKE